MASKEREAILVAAAYTPGLAFRLILAYLRMKRQAKRARHNFYIELRRGGLPRRDAKELADEYVLTVSLRSTLHTIAELRG
ncbi:MAG: hypothetical protein GX307_00750 [Euryarchaeota archaeon]|nr:hypothetical protein [Euryarchaeota archaeon]